MPLHPLRLVELVRLRLHLPHCSRRSQALLLCKRLPPDWSPATAIVVHNTQARSVASILEIAAVNTGLVGILLNTVEMAAMLDSVVVMLCRLHWS